MFLWILTALCYCSSYSEVAVFSVHIMSTTARIIAQPDSNVLNLGRRLIVHLWEWSGKWNALSFSLYLSLSASLSHAHTDSQCHSNISLHWSSSTFSASSQNTKIAIGQTPHRVQIFSCDTMEDLTASLSVSFSLLPCTLSTIKRNKQASHTKQKNLHIQGYEENHFGLTFPFALIFSTTQTNRPCACPI